jgi:small multidrug resistance pump
MGNLFLLFTILSETAAVICMKLSTGFQNKLYTVVAVITYALSFVFLTLSLKSLPAGIANAIWAGASTVLVTALGIFIFKERLSTVQMVSIVFIVLGLVGLNWKGGL